MTKLNSAEELPGGMRGVQSPQLLGLVASLSALMLQIKRVADGERNAAELQAIKESLLELKEARPCTGAQRKDALLHARVEPSVKEEHVVLCASIVVAIEHLDGPAHAHVAGGVARTAARSTLERSARTVSAGQGCRVRKKSAASA